MLMNLALSNIASKTKKNIVSVAQSNLVANDDNFINYFSEDNLGSSLQFPYDQQIILEPGLTFRNITNNTREPMDITPIIAAMDKQLEIKFSSLAPI